MSETEKQQEQQQQPAQQQTLPKRVALKDEPYYANCAMVQMTQFDLIVERNEDRSGQAVPLLVPYVACEDCRAPLLDCHNLKAWTTAPGTHHARGGSTLLEGSLGSGARGKITPVTDGNGQQQLAEVYDKQIYLSHLQARALYDALRRSLSSLRTADRSDVPR